MKAKPIIIGVVAVALVAILVNDVVKKDDHALERVSERAGLSVNCKILSQDGKRWGVCRYKNGAPASVWLDRDATWIAANGNAIEVVGKLANVQDLQNLPAVMVDYQSPPTMPGALLEQ
ncbi:hypothetical protein M5G22_29045 [Pseudomonas sp. TNT2022 ID233]|uniref:hypothetical protein n=1 Tax=Pseudomonas aphyarum TaxID=2942629 RepID=UPI002361DFDB|nr:hypothetical protein [Pseudomonas aphyarum]MDD1141621.1 hypothetical protein [Pseudomonas aphyarum]